MSGLIPLAGALAGIIAGAMEEEHGSADCGHDYSPLWQLRHNGMPQPLEDAGLVLRNALFRFSDVAFPWPQRAKGEMGAPSMPELATAGCQVLGALLNAAAAAAEWQPVRDKTVVPFRGVPK